MMVHASFACSIDASIVDSRPFPTRRLTDRGYNFVGAQMFGHARPYDKMCPVPCRPKEHMDWENC